MPINRGADMSLSMRAGRSSAAGELRWRAIPWTVGRALALGAALGLATALAI